MNGLLALVLPDHSMADHGFDKLALIGGNGVESFCGLGSAKSLEVYGRTEEQREVAWHF